MVDLAEKRLSFVSAKSLERYEVVTVKPIQLPTLWNSAFPNWRSLEKFIFAASDRSHPLHPFLSICARLCLCLLVSLCKIYFCPLAPSLPSGCGDQFMSGSKKLLMTLDNETLSTKTFKDFLYVLLLNSRPIILFVINMPDKKIFYTIKCYSQVLFI